MESKSELLMRSLRNYYKENDKINLVLPVITQQTRISLRILDWLVTNYSKKFNSNYLLGKENIYIYKSYKNQLKSYSKKLFDPFCRRERIMINKNTLQNTQENDPEVIITTVGQLNFFKWAIENKILDYAVKNLDEIELDMNSSIKKFDLKGVKQKVPPLMLNNKGPSIIKFC